ncbi:unnamed protein product [Paramecium sonneborni]|uniref:Uncharacterized protein n=1 Tax=Paramecium sonneborni TaxID=65129 RepID=A0A8S1RV31_9CILI|nr:unnamed protein product [Paramecium sonneborni]
MLLNSAKKQFMLIINQQIQIKKLILIKSFRQINRSIDATYLFYHTLYFRHHQNHL